MSDQTAPSTTEAPVLTTDNNHDGQPTQTPTAETPVTKTDDSVSENQEPKPAPSWQELLDQTDAKELRRHPKVAGIIGSERQDAERKFQLHHSQKSESERLERQEKAFLDLVEGNTDYIKEHHPLVHDRYIALQQERASREVASIRGNTVHEIAAAIGRAMHDVPEWQQLAEQDHQAIAKELANKSDDEVLPIFNRMAIQLVSKKMLDKWKAEELAKEREAIRKEVNAQIMREGDAPDMTRSKSASKQGIVDVNSMSQEEFNKYWEGLKKTK